MKPNCWALWTLYTILLPMLPLAQQPSRCAWDYIQGEYTKYAHHSSSLRSHQTKSQAGVVVTIPVVFHIIHQGQAEGSGENISTSLLMAQLDQLNDDFRRNNSDRANTPAMFAGVAADLEIEFCLAQQDPDGFPTTGIVRYNYGLPDYSPTELKHIVQSRTTWDRDDYLNIWVADLRGYLGYAFLPGGEAIGDGLVLDYAAVGSLTQPNPVNSPYKYGRTATHEIGHWLGLDHQWAVSNDCSTDDGVSDTPIQYNYYLGQPTHPQTSCGSTDMFMNFLDYVDDLAMNLYTEGQKAVMRNTLWNERATLQSSVACDPPSPVIMFESTEMASLEGTENCGAGAHRSIAITMKIAAPPSRTATVILAPNGSAIEGVDYTLSQNSLTFPAGSMASQSFTVTWAQDAFVEGFKDIILDYSLSSGGGNAQKGPHNQSVTVDLIDDDFVATPQGYSDITVGQDMGSGTLASPFRGSRSDTRMQMIYTASELSNAGLQAGYIDQVSFFVTQKSSTLTYSNFNVKLAPTQRLDYPQYSHFIFGVPSYYSGDIYSIAGKMQIVLDQPFYWDGHSNIILETCYDNDSGTYDDKVKFENTLLNTVLIEARDNTNGCLLNYMPSRSTLRPVVEFRLKNGCQVASEINTAGGYMECEFPPNAIVYFTDVNSEKIMMSIENLSGFDFGCTRVEIDRAGSGASLLWGQYDATPKSFFIQPENPSSGGQLKVNLYYTREEVESWERENRLGSTIGDMYVLKCDRKVIGSTAADCASYPMAFQNFGDDYVMTATIGGDFSGFTLSNWPSGFLAIKNLEVSANKVENVIQLNAFLTGDFDRDSLTWYKHSFPDDRLTVLFNDVIASDLITICDTPSACGEVHYYAVAKEGSGRKLTSKVLSFTCTDPWDVLTSSSEITIRNNDQPSLYRLTTINGKEVFSVQLDAYETKSLHLQYLPTSVYVLCRKNGNHVQTKRIFVSH